MVNPTFQDPPIPRIELLQVYGHRVWHAKYLKCRMDRLGKESVSQAWGVIATSHLLNGMTDPTKPSDSQAHTGLDKGLTQKLKTYGLEDPPCLTRKRHPPGNHALHHRHGSYRL